MSTPYAVPPEARGLQRRNASAAGPPPLPRSKLPVWQQTPERLRLAGAVRGFAHKVPICAAGSESFVSVEDAGSNGPRQIGRLTLHRKVARRHHVRGWLDSSFTLRVALFPRRQHVRLAFVRVAALLSLPGGWLATCTAESSRLLSLPDGKEIEDAGIPPASRGPLGCPPVEALLFGLLHAYTRLHVGGALRPTDAVA